ncbi:double-strand break repair protein AddB [Mangrovibrevibacter kandeliae]|uniref:double-strand break repair protein AddB n=1 Tax=Mangrovibrevibacter kandeliae TaxID=2968473 RepID=UPI0021191D9A|nr:double-strand break repair protein AddB [Aurantimonas sp. CSK15Z-1]MCQ8782221.1 double-strand break repair protein AddB [Aurantimonas sp. CSK15Z-1]
MPRASVVSIPPGLPFLPTLADSLIAGRVVKGFHPEGDPLALASLTVYVPTRRAARGLASAFGQALGGVSAILPAIRTLGEEDETALFRAEGALDGLTPVADPVEQRLLIASLVRQWRRQIREETLRAIGSEALSLPASAADAVWLAGDLVRLLAEIETEEAEIAGLAGLAPDRLAHWWQLTLTFLQILTEHWPQILAERGHVSDTEARNRRLRRLAAQYRQEGAPGPVVIAGSTATAPAVAELMRAVAGLPNGALVLPGLDRHLSDEDFATIDAARSLATVGHPQHGLKRILARLQLPREAVDHLDLGLDPVLAAREAFVADALRPAETTAAWGDSRNAHPPAALDGLALIEADDEREEALAIACAMRAALADPEKTVALTTPDRKLARRVTVELKRFGIEANDSAGRPLTGTAPGTLMLTAAEVALRPGDPVRLVALLKHPLLRLGRTAGEARRAARTIEMVALRGGVGRADLVGLAALYGQRRRAFEGKDAETGERVFVARPVQLLPEEDRDLAADVAEALEKAFAPLTALRGAPAAEIGAYATALTQVLEALCRDPEGDASELYAQEAGGSLAAFLSGLVACPPTGFAFDAVELPDVLVALAAGETVKPRGGLSARAFVWGALEARLQSVDTMVLAGLNEGTWPGAARSDAFLSRIMRAEIALDPPERRIGLAAHDLQMALGSRRVILTRSRRSGGAPSVASRWLQRLLTVAGASGEAQMRAEGDVYRAHARALDRGPTESYALDRTPATDRGRPFPRPPLSLRPRQVSVTEVERLIRDPYAVYARRILKLEKLPPLLRDPGAAERGTLYHRILARYVLDGNDPTVADAIARLIDVAAQEFEREALPPEVHAVWWPRMETLAQNYIAWERERDAGIRARIAECRGEWDFPDIATRLTGYADRIDVTVDGRLQIIDFKTGTEPSVKQARALLAPQLPLEGAMARLGAFAGDLATPGPLADLLYVRLREKAFKEDGLAGTEKGGLDYTADGLADAALEKFRQLVAAYKDEQMGYRSRARPFKAGDFSGDYDHLARAREWSIGLDAAEDAP